MYQVHATGDMYTCSPNSIRKQGLLPNLTEAHLCHPEIRIGSKARKGSFSYTHFEFKGWHMFSGAELEKTPGCWLLLTKTAHAVYFYPHIVFESQQLKLAVARFSAVCTSRTTKPQRTLPFIVSIEFKERDITWDCKETWWLRCSVVALLAPCISSGFP